MRYTKEQVTERFQKMPEQVQNAILSIETDNVALLLRDKYNLHVHQAGIFGEEVVYVLVGLTRAENFVDNLSSRLELPEETILAIAKDANEQIFKKIRELLKQHRGSSQKLEPATSLKPKIEQLTTSPTPQERRNPQGKPAVPIKPKEPKRERLIQEIEKPKQREFQAQSAPEKVDEIHHTPLPTNTTKVEPLPSLVNKTLMEKHDDTKNPQGIEEETEKQYSTDPYREPIEPNDKQ